MLETNPPILHAQEVGKTYRLHESTVEALREVNLTIYPGEFVAIMGPSGSGKSTLLNVLGGLDIPTRGKVYLNGVEISTLGEDARTLLRRQQLGFVFQSYELLPFLSAAQNVEFPLAVAAVPALERNRRAVGLLEQMGLAGKKDALPDALSGGQKQRVAIARALANHPRVILADEPTGSLDSLTAGDVLNLLRQAVAELKTTVVMVTHDEDDARRADRIIRLRDGRIESDNH